MVKNDISRKIFQASLLFTILIQSLPGQIEAVDTLASDTLILDLPFDSVNRKKTNDYNIIDRRNQKENHLGITKIKKYFFIPVNQHIIVNNSISRALACRLEEDSIDFSGRLVLDNLTMWYDPKPYFSKSYMINGRSYITKNGKPIKDWQWSIRRKKGNNETKSKNLSLLFNSWLKAQADSLSEYKLSETIYPFKYRRVLKNWYDIIFLKNGFIINGNLTLDFPQSHKNFWTFGSAGIFYRKSKKFQSLGLSGLDQHWAKRINNKVVMRINTTLRLGLNKFNSDRFEKIKPYNLLMANLGLSCSMKYQPIYHRGVFFGGGLYLHMNGLPYIPNKIDIIEPGAILILGVRLP